MLHFPFKLKKNETPVIDEKQTMQLFEVAHSLQPLPVLLGFQQVRKSLWWILR